MASSSFTVASVACGLRPVRGVLVVGRAVQGLGGAAVSAVALALIMGLFSDPGERAKAMGVFGFVMSGGGAVGVLLGGVLTGLLSWHWIFLVNVPIGIAVWLGARRVLPRRRARRGAGTTPSATTRPPSSAERVTAPWTSMLCSPWSQGRQSGASLPSPATWSRNARACHANKSFWPWPTEGSP